MSIWFDQSISLEKIKEFGKDSMAEFLGMEWTSIGDDFLEMSLPVNEKTKQPYGLLHGGASCVLAETVGSVASALVIDMNKPPGSRRARGRRAFGSSRPRHPDSASPRWPPRAGAKWRSAAGLGGRSPVVVTVVGGGLVRPG